METRQHESRLSEISHNKALLGVASTVLFVAGVAACHEGLATSAPHNTSPVAEKSVTAKQLGVVGIDGIIARECPDMSEADIATSGEFKIVSANPDIANNPSHQIDVTQAVKIPRDLCNVNGEHPNQIPVIYQKP